MSTLDDRLQQQLNGRKNEGTYRSLKRSAEAIDFFSNDYLGISLWGLQKPFLDTDSAIHKPGATGSRLISGNYPAIEALESLIAQHHGGEAALVFNSGYTANMGLLTAIAGRHTIFIYDELCHASIIDGIRSSLCKGKQTYRHNDLESLAATLELNQEKGELVVVTESLFSMDGDIAPLGALAEICNRYDAKLIVDEAHATGVYGDRGEGLVDSLQLRAAVWATVHTYGKAMGSHGAAVVGTALLKEYLINFSRPFIYTTALPPQTVADITAAYRFLSSSNYNGKQLHHVIDSFRGQVNALGIAGWMDNKGPIQVYIPQSPAALLPANNWLTNHGIAVKAIVSPTVPKGKERLRVCLHAFNTKAEIKYLLDLLLTAPAM